MCSVSYIADDWNRTRAPVFEQILSPQVPGSISAEFEALKVEFQELKLLLLAAKRYDEKTGQKDCEMAEKIAMLKKMAALLGVDLSDVFPTS